MMSCEKIKELISGYLDDELTQGDFQRVAVHMRTCQDCRQTYDDLANLRKAVANSSSKTQLSDQQWENIMNDLPARASKGIGWILLVAGVITLVSFAIWEFAIDQSVQWYIKLAVGSVWFGLLFLLLSVARQRIVAYKKDKYKDIQI